MTYWHIAEVNEDGLPALGHGDGRLIRVGETLTVAGKIEFCENGLHACKGLTDCLPYCEGTVICEVELGGEIVHDGDKSAATQRTVLRMTTAEDGEKILRSFARWCALSVAHLWEMPPIVRQYLETGDESASAAASEAARAAASAAASEAAWEAARVAASAAASEAAWVAARVAQKKKLVEMVRECLQEQA